MNEIRMKKIRNLNIAVLSKTIEIYTVGPKIVESQAVPKIITGVYL